MKVGVKFRRNTYPSYPETFSELELLREKTALIIIDMQNDFLHPQGGFAKKGVDVSGAVKLIPLVKQVADACRQTGIPVIYRGNLQYLCRDDIAFHLSPRLPLSARGGLHLGKAGRSGGCDQKDHRHEFRLSGDFRRHIKDAE